MSSAPAILVTPPDEHGNCFLLAVDPDGRPLPPAEPSAYDREGA